MGSEYVGQESSDTKKFQKVVAVIQDNSNNELKLDTSTSAMTTIEYEHHEIHGGSHYFVAGFEVINDGGTAIFAMTTPDTKKWVHLRFDVSTTSRLEFSIGEDATINGGTAVTPNNNDRNSSNTSGVVLVKNPGISHGGTVIFSSTSGLEGVSKTPAIGSGISANQEIILKQNSIYVFTLTSRDDTNNVSYVSEWYEHTNNTP